MDGSDRRSQRETDTFRGLRRVEGLVVKHCSRVACNVDAGISRIDDHVVGWGCVTTLTASRSCSLAVRRPAEGCSDVLGQALHRDGGLGRLGQGQRVETCLRAVAGLARA
ncbi:MAG TPA: hypothetical protein VFY98_05230 [Intrasporangium sp.]|nr:hypothetical protein [Intrasporangium sp.]